MISNREEKPGDIRASHHVNEQAFEQESEANIGDKLRKRGALTISLVAIRDTEMIQQLCKSVARDRSATSFAKSLTCPK